MHKEQECGEQAHPGEWAAGSMLASTDKPAKCKYHRAYVYYHLIYLDVFLQL
jgi:hypothetical protein